MPDRQLSLYYWFKKNPKEYSMNLYPKPNFLVPAILRTRASLWIKWFAPNGEHPGDGVMYFHDFLLSPAMKDLFPNTFLPSNYIQYAKLFNYLWSFSAEGPSGKGPLSVRAGMVLAVVLLKKPKLSIPLYENRKKINLKDFSRFAAGVLTKRHLHTISDFARNTFAVSDIERWLWETILGVGLDGLWDRNLSQFQIL